MHISTLVVSIFLLAAFADASVLSRLTDVFNTPPEFSHAREKYVPQNVDIIEVIDPSKKAPLDNINPKGKPHGKPSKIAPPMKGIAIQPPSSNQKGGFINKGSKIKTGVGLPIVISPAAGGVLDKKPGNIGGVGLPVSLGQKGQDLGTNNARGVVLPHQNPRMSRDGASTKKAGKPSVRGRPMGQMFNTQNSFRTGQSQVAPVKSSSPTKATSNIRTNPVANDRLVNTMFKNGNTGGNRRPVNVRKPAMKKKRNCDFNIPSFLLPDMTVSQREFEQMYLLPALRAHLTARECRSRALTVYIDWLLYLRLRNFNV